MKKFVLLFISSLLLTLLCDAETIRYEIEIKDHKFIPNVIEAPSGAIIKLKIINLDPTIEEFESFDLKREKIVIGNGGSIIITVGPLQPGEYTFFGEFNPKTAQGKLIIKEKNHA